MNTHPGVLRPAGLCALTAAILLGSASSAWAEGPIRLGKVSGPSWSRVRAAVQVVLSRKGVPLASRGTIESGRIGGVVTEVGGGLVAELSLIDGAGRVRARSEFRGSNGRELAGDVKGRLWSLFGSQIEVLTAAQSIEPAPAPTPARRAEKQPKRARRKTSRAARAEPAPRRSRPAAPAASTASPSNRIEEPGGARNRRQLPRILANEALRFRLGVGIFARELSWVDDLFQTLAGYQLGAAPAFGVETSWYPGAHFDDGPLSWIGLDLAAELPFAVESNREGTTFPTAASAWRLGVVGRIPVDWFEARFGAGFGERRFSLEVSDDGLPVPDLPEVRYQSLGLRLGFTVRLADRVDVDARGGWGFMLDAGAIGRGPWFPRSQSHTASAGAGLALHIDGGVSAYGRFDWEGAFFNLQPEPGDARVAGGASDQFYLASIGVSFAGR